MIPRRQRYPLRRDSAIFKRASSLETSWGRFFWERSSAPLFAVIIPKKHVPLSSQRNKLRRIVARELVQNSQRFPHCVVVVLGKKTISHVDKKVIYDDVKRFFQDYCSFPHPSL